jgi:hypothetical protein
MNMVSLFMKSFLKTEFDLDPGFYTFFLSLLHIPLELIHCVDKSNFIAALQVTYVSQNRITGI